MAKGRKKVDTSRTRPLFFSGPTGDVPSEPPNLDGVVLLGVDTETNDPNMEERGPGFIRKDATILGVSIATEDDDWYFPMNHVSDNCTWNVQEWLQDEFRNERRKYVFCNAHYDVEALWSIDAVPAGPWTDISLIQALIDEEFEGGYGLDNIATYYLGKGKDTTGLLLAGADLGCGDLKATMKRLQYMPGNTVAPYARTDARVTLDAYLKQLPLIEEWELGDLLEMEEKLLGLTWLMRLRGVKFDMEKAESMRLAYITHETRLLGQLYEMTGQRVDVWSPKSICKICHKYGIKWIPTDAGNPSFKGDWLDTHENPALQLIAEVRKYSKMRSDFIESWMDFSINGRIHARWKQTMTEDGGTRSGRMASSDPNLQQVPVRDKIHGPALRSLFIPERQWGKFDYQAQEIRIGAHFAKTSHCDGADEIVERYKKDPLFDFHTFIANMASIERTPAKTLGLGAMYGMGSKKTMASLNMSQDKAEWVYNEYHKAAPWVNKLLNLAMERAEKRGYVRTFLGRVRRFKNGNMTHKALNAVIQGTAADMIKKAVLDVWYIMDIVPLVVVHDEAGYDVADDIEARDIADHMERALDLEVPMIVEPTLGSSWNVG
jgi:DNA polymerase I